MKTLHFIKVSDTDGKTLADPGLTAKIAGALSCYLKLLAKIQDSRSPYHKKKDILF